MFSDDPKDSMSIRNLSKLSLGALEHTSSIVREAGQELVLLLYRYIIYINQTRYRLNIS